MTQFFEAQVKYLQEGPNGLIRSMKSTYLVDAMTFTETESRLTEELADTLKEFTLAACKRSNISEVVLYGDTAKWFKCKITYTAATDDGDNAKKVINYILVNADNVEQADERLKDHLEPMQVPYEVPSIVESKISEVMEYSPKTGQK